MVTLSVAFVALRKLNIWNSVFIVFSIQPPTRVAHLFGSWLMTFFSKLRI